ncbi:cell death 2 [Octopus vulgaris]|uniref:Cell death 2 n=1 Tax=Octopus vulgaris TaxID=6645 RepID=A0AA36BYY8_OCTVU|nr:cell death 2 [Octopus vulgaris]
MQFRGMSFRGMSFSEGGASRDQPGVLFKEYELVTETEELESDANDSSEEDENSGGVGVDGSSSNTAIIKAGPGKDKKKGSGGHLKDLEAYARKETSDDKEFLKFRRRIRPDPEQVVRYHLGGNVLWVSSDNKPSEHSIPPCSSCGAQRIFEFQVMPQLLTHLGVDLLDDSLDWGTLAVYTCADSCDIGVKYVQEFLWKQDYSSKCS